MSTTDDHDFDNIFDHDHDGTDDYYISANYNYNGANNDHPAPNYNYTATDHDGTDDHDEYPIG